MRKVMFWLSVLATALAGIYGLVKHPTVDFCISWLSSISCIISALAFRISDDLDKKQ